MPLILVDVEAGPAPGQHPDLREFGAVEFISDEPFYRETFHGVGTDLATFQTFYGWLLKVCGMRQDVVGDKIHVSPKTRPIFVSDNPAFDFQWINYYFWKHMRMNPFGHSARRISDFYAGLVGDFTKTQEWKALRRTPHDHNPVHDAIGNAEALGRLLKGERP